MANKFEYNFQHINALLKNIFQNDNEIIVRKAIHLSTVKETIKEICDDLKLDIKLKKAAILPIFNSLNNCSNHWVGLIIKKQNNQLQAIYVDSVDKSTDYLLDGHNSLVKILKNNNVNIMQFYLIKQHDNLVDCGPWMVFNVRYLAINGELPTNVNEQAINTQRNELINLLQQERQSYDMNPATKIEITKSSMREIYELNEEKNKYRDVGQLEKILEILNICEADQSDIKSSMRSIGEICTYISPYDSKRNNSQNIRNSYGYVQKTLKNSIIKPEGFPFNKLQALRNVLDNEQKIGGISDDDWNILLGQMKNLEQSLLHILKKEIVFVSKQSTIEKIRTLLNTKPNFDEFIKTCDHYYRKLLLHQLNEKLSQFEHFECNDTEDRYIVARAMIIIGDLSNELADCYVDQKSKEHKILRKLYSMRSKIVHCHKKMKNEKPNKAKEINGKILYVFNLLKKNISFDINFTQGSAEEIEKAIKDIDEYFDYSNKLYEETHKPNRKTNENPKDIKNNLDMILLGAGKNIESNEKLISEKKNPKPIEDQLKRLDSNYQSQLSRIDDKEKLSFPPKIEITYKDEIMWHKNIHIPITPKRDEKTHNIRMTDVNDKIGQIMKDIDVEIEYLQGIEDKMLDTHKNKQVILHIVFVVTQYVRKIGELLHNNPKGVDLILNFNENKSLPQDLTDTFVSEHDKRLSKYLLTSLLDRTDYINYLYTYPEFEINVITPILLCNIGVSFFKLGLNPQAIKYLEEAVTRVVQFEERFVISDQMEDFRLNNLCKNRYKFQIEKTLANILLRDNNNSSSREALKIFEKVHQQIKMVDLNTIDNEEFKEELINFLIDYGWALTDNDEFDRSIEIFDSINDLTDDLSVKLKIMEAKCCKSKFVGAQQLFDEMIKLFSDDGEIIKCKIWSSFLSMCLYREQICLDRGEGIKNAEHCLDQINEIENDILKIINNESDLGKLKILYTKLLVEKDLSPNNLELLKKSYSANSHNQLVALIYLNLSWINAKNIQSNFDKKKFADTKEYLDIAQQKLTKNESSNTILKMKIIAHFLSLACNKHSKTYGQSYEQAIHLLVEAFFLEEKFGIQSHETFQNLGLQYSELSKNYFHKSNGNSECKEFAQAVSLMHKSKVCYDYASKLLPGNDNFKENPAWLDLMKACSLSCYDYALKYFDIKSMERAYSCFKFLKVTSFEVHLKIRLSRKRDECKEELKAFKNFLDQYFDNECNIQETILNIRMVKYCNFTFKMDLRFVEGELSRVYDVQILKNLQTLGDKLRNIE